MQVPQESLDDFNIDLTKLAEPPPEKSLQLTGKIEVLQPLARTDQLVRFRAATGRSLVRRRETVPATGGLSWYHRSLAISGVVSIGAMLIGIFAGIYAPSEPNTNYTELVREQMTEGVYAYRDEAETKDISPANAVRRLSNERLAVRATERRKIVRPRVRRAAYKSSNSVPPPQFVVSEFVPTTLIVYVENGEVKTRIESQGATGHKRKT